MNKKIIKIIFGIIFILLVSIYILYRIDKTYWRDNRVLINDWEFDSGYYISGMICGKCSEIYHNDTLFLNKEHLVIIKYQFKNVLVVSDIHSKKSTKFRIIGSHMK